MSLFIASLNTGSNGNCFYIGNRDEAILVDAGISCRETERRMKRLELSVKRVKGIFITHEHSDHIAGVTKLARKFQWPVYITDSTFRQSRLTLQAHHVKPFYPHEPVVIGNLRVIAFPKHHDACDPHSFIVSCNSVSVGVFTDIGSTCDHVIKYFKQCHAVFLEANYDVELLDKGSYPLYLKNRIRGGQGHLSNDEALKLFMDHRPDFMSHLFLSHLSRNNNNPAIVQDLFSSHAGETEIVIASRYEETKVYHILNTAVHDFKMKSESAPLQLSLF